MSKEELIAEESLISYRKEPKWAGKMFMRDENTCYKDGFLAGLKVGKLKWHDLRKNKNDLPDDYRYVWTNVGAGYFDGDIWWSDSGRLQNVVA